MTRIVGNRNRSEFILDPLQALQHGAIVDAMLAAAYPPRSRGVVRASHSAMNAMDDERQLEVARRINRRS